MRNFGRFRWLRLPFGLCTAPEEFQRRLSHALEGLKGVRTIHDDILVFGEGSTEDEALVDHDRNLRSLMQRCREQNVKLNKAKVKLRCGEVPFLGHLITKDGLKADPAKIRAVLEMPTPTYVASVRRFIGFTNYLSKFLPRLSDVHYFKLMGIVNSIPNEWKLIIKQSQQHICSPSNDTFEINIDNATANVFKVTSKIFTMNLNAKNKRCLLLKGK